MNFGEWVRREITRHGKTVTWLALQIEADRSLIIKWRTRGSVPRAKNFLSVCIVLAGLDNSPLADTLERGANVIGINMKL